MTKILRKNAIFCSVTKVREPNRTRFVEVLTHLNTLIPEQTATSRLLLLFLLFWINSRFYSLTNLIQCLKIKNNI